MQNWRKADEPKNGNGEIADGKQNGETNENKTGQKKWA